MKAFLKEIWKNHKKKILGVVGAAITAAAADGATGWTVLGSAGKTLGFGP